MSRKTTLALLGCPLDCDERQESVDQKLAALSGGGGDPYEQVVEILRREADPSLWREAGRLETPPWLRPVPPPGDRGAMVVENFIDFIDRGGCADFAASTGRMVDEAAFPDTPCLIAVDHSLAGGVIRSLSDRHGAENLTVVVLDSHLDALPGPVLAGAVAYDLETNPHFPYDPRDPFIHGRPDSYNASSFLLHLLEQGAVLPSNLFILGVSDYPPKRAFRIKDPRIRAYTGIFKDLKSEGVHLLTKQDLASSGKLRSVLNRIDTPFVYVSIDMDVGARNAVRAVRFDNRTGLNRAQINRIARELRLVLDRGPALAGLDLTEFNPRLASTHPEVYRLAADLIRILAW